MPPNWVCGAPRYAARRLPTTPYSRTIYDPFWVAGQSDLGIPISLHVITGRRHIPDRGGIQKPIDAGDIVANYLFLTVDMQHTFSDSDHQGVLERFPKLKIVSAENDTGWLPHFIYRMDHTCERSAWELLAQREAQRISEAPIVGHVSGRSGRTRDIRIFGANNYMWASDFPHSDCTWPHSREVIKAISPKFPKM